MSEALLFAELPAFDLPLPQDELRLLAALPDYGSHECVQAVEPEDEATARRLEKRGLIKIKRQKDDPIAIRPTFYCGRLTALAAA